WNEKIRPPPPRRDRAFVLPSPPRAQRPPGALSCSGEARKSREAGRREVASDNQNIHSFLPKFQREGPVDMVGKCSKVLIFPKISEYSTTVRGFRSPEKSA